MSYNLPTSDLNYLRELAKQQAEIAALPVMAERKALWRAMNDATPGARPPFAIETWTFDRDFMPASIFKCESNLGRNLENNFLRNIRHHQILNDDHVCPDTIDVHWHVWYDEFGMEIKTDTVLDAEGVSTGYHFDCPVKDLRDGFDCIKPATFGVDRDATSRHFDFMNESFGDIMPVVLRMGHYANPCLTQRLMRIMTMETFFTAMYDCPDILHALMAQLRDNSARLSLWSEAEGLLTLNNENQNTCGTCYNFTTILPRSPVTWRQIKLSDLWVAMDSQETVGVSPDMFHEFCFPYYRDLAAMFGLVYWGCCEPADPIWEQSLSKLPNLKAVSISRWADERYMADQLDGKGIVYSRKPNPNLLGIHPELDEAAWCEEIRNTLKIVANRNIPFQFVVRDVYSMHGNLAKAGRAVTLARAEIERFYQ
ncbi:MAG: hypothetical protein GX230_03155 [Lentisphaerae bacterium]|jgi:hypothetical protein|nr:hypothetical protein [Lentisphaerota bacterium]